MESTSDSSYDKKMLALERKFRNDKATNPNFKVAASLIKVPKKSLFAKSRENEVSEKEEFKEKEFDKEIERTSSVLGDIVEKCVSGPKKSILTEEISQPFPKIPKLLLNPGEKGKSSLFLQTISSNKLPMISSESPSTTTSLVSEDSREVHIESAGKTINTDGTQEDSSKYEKMEVDETNYIDKIEEQGHSSAESSYKLSSTLPKEAGQNFSSTSSNNKLLHKFGESSVIVENETASEIHDQNISLLGNMKEEEILAERKKLFDSIDPTLIEFLKKKRIEKNANLKQMGYKKINEEKQESMDEILKNLPENSPALQLVEQSKRENWINFNVVEQDKLAWIQDVPDLSKDLKPGEKFEARFDWKGVLLPYDFKEDPSNDNVKDDRDLYMHGDEPHRPGYTLQELFRLARSSVTQQRISAFSAIAGLLNIYNQGFYDQVLDLPISKIFFLLRFGLDDNTQSMLEVVSKAMAYLFFNETDERLLDFIYDNPGCYWQPTLEVSTLNERDDENDLTSVENIQKQLERCQLNTNKSKAFKANIDEEEHVSKTSMSDFHLAENDLIECFVRTNMLQKISFILSTIKPENSTVTSCLKLLIRLARSGKDKAMDIVNKDDLMKCLIESFLPNFDILDTSEENLHFYNYPQHLCLKLLRVLSSQNLGIAIKISKMNIVEKMQNYLYNRKDIKGKLIEVQIESLRLLRCFLLYNVDDSLYKQFLPALRYMLEWHYNHLVYQVGGPYLLRQHASALLAVIASIPQCRGMEVNSLLGETLRDCCCSWFHKATNFGLKEFSQATLLSSCLNVVTWFARNNDDTIFENFNKKILPTFLESKSFLEFIQTLSSSSILAKPSLDRRNIHQPLPNVGSIIMSSCGPQLIIPQNYCFYFLLSFWRLLEIKLNKGDTFLLTAITKPSTMENIVRLLTKLMVNCNPILATNFFAKMEVIFIYKILCLEGLQEHFSKSQLMQVAYNFLCCLTSEHVKEIEDLFQRYIFNANFINEDEDILKQWKNTFLEMVYPQAIYLEPVDMKLSLPVTQLPILPRDWPYYQLRILLQNFIDNVQLKPSELYSEKQVLKMTLQFVSQLKENANLEIASPTEELMYLMICFMGPDTQFLKPEMHDLLKYNILRFYDKYKDHTFDLEEVHEGKCRFENLYFLFVDHFQFVSYGDELYSSLVLLPLALKYPIKYRGRIWSDYGGALRWLDCDESLLLGGINAYLEPAERAHAILSCYCYALQHDLVLPNTVPHKIALHHMIKSRERRQKNILEGKQHPDS